MRSYTHWNILARKYETKKVLVKTSVQIATLSDRISILFASFGLQDMGIGLVIMVSSVYSSSRFFTTFKNAKPPKMTNQITIKFIDAISFTIRSIKAPFSTEPFIC